MPHDPSVVDQLIAAGAQPRDAQALAEAAETVGALVVTVSGPDLNHARLDLAMHGIEALTADQARACLYAAVLTIAGLNEGTPT